MTSKKNARIAELEDALGLAEANLGIEKLDRKAATDVAERRATQATVDQIESGLIPVAALRALIYKTERYPAGPVGAAYDSVLLHLPDLIPVTDPIAEAIRKALTRPERPKYATGGIISGGYAGTGPGGPFDRPDSGYVIPKSTLSRLGIDLLADLNRKTHWDDDVVRVAA